MKTKSIVLARAPMRISFACGGTDLPSYSKRFGGIAVSAAITKYYYAILHVTHDNPIRLNYSQQECVEDVDEIKHNVFREALKQFGIKSYLELSCITDFPEGTGMGGSGAFTVALLLALHDYMGDRVSKEELAKEACSLEIEVCKYSTGKQDQYTSAYGGINKIDFNPDGSVSVEPLGLREEVLKQLRFETLLFNTNLSKMGADIQREIQNNVLVGTDSVNRLHSIKANSVKVYGALRTGDLIAFGKLMDSHWQIKRGLSERISNSYIDECYKRAKDSGAIGGKLCGSGGGGFLYMYCPNGTRSLVKQALQKDGLTFFDYDFDYQGAKIMVSE
jgi:D-glycero-alpha-D-manno-heptose-7-phosphate kinase